MTLQTKIKECNFDFVNNDITEENFPYEAVRSTDFVVYYPNKSVSSEDVLKFFKENNLEPANIYELLEYTENEWDGKTLVVALGSVALLGGDRRVASLGQNDGERALGLGWFDFDWFDGYRFLAVRKSPNTGGTTTQKMTLEEILKIANDILSGDEAFESDSVQLDIAQGQPVTPREKNLANVVSKLYRLIHPHFSTCQHPDWVQEAKGYATEDILCDFCKKLLCKIREGVYESTKPVTNATFSPEGNYHNECKNASKNNV